VNNSLTLFTRSIPDPASSTDAILRPAPVAKIETSTRRMVVDYKMKDPSSFIAARNSW
jgi:hypothetical protein